jgi:hypothetical protein
LHIPRLSAVTLSVLAAIAVVEDMFRDVALLRA